MSENINFKSFTLYPVTYLINYFSGIITRKLKKLSLYTGILEYLSLLNPKDIVTTAQISLLKFIGYRQKSPIIMNVSLAFCAL